MDQVLTGSMTPVHGSPNRTIWMVLKKQMIYTFIIDKPIRIIHPIFSRRKMNLRTIDFIIGMIRILGGNFSTTDQYKYYPNNWYQFFHLTIFMNDIIMVK